MLRPAGARREAWRGSWQAWRAHAALHSPCSRGRAGPAGVPRAEIPARCASVACCSSLTCTSAGPTRRRCAAGARRACRRALRCPAGRVGAGRRAPRKGPTSGVTRCDLAARARWPLGAVCQQERGRERDRSAAVAAAAAAAAAAAGPSPSMPTARLPTCPMSSSCLQAPGVGQRTAARCWARGALAVRVPAMRRQRGTCQSKHAGGEGSPHLAAAW
jgi:hypothetical protein